MQNRDRKVFPLLFLFIILNAFLLTGHSFLVKQGIDVDVLIVANILFFLTNFISFFLQRRAMQNANPNVFVRSIMAGTMIKMLVVAGAFVVYLMLAGKAVNKPAVYVSISLYFLYLAVEVAIVMKMNKNKNA